MKKAIVTGANGFVGRALVKCLLSEGYEVFAVVRGETSFFEDMNNVMPIVCDLRNISSLPKLLPSEKIDVFFHLAWAGSAKQSERTDYQLQIQNLQGTIEALKVSASLSCNRFISSGSIMEEELNLILHKNQALPGMSYIYGAAKQAAHGFLLPLAVELGVELLWTQITNTYGVGERSERMVISTLKKCIRGECPTFTAATQNYDFIYIDDVAKAFCAIAEKGIPFSNYIIGSGQAKALKEFLLEMQQSVAPELDFIFGDIPFTGVNLPVSSFNTDSLKKDTGFDPTISFSEGCARTYRWLEGETS